MIKEYSDSDFVEYVIVVHGIGEQRQNETLIPVINRFAEARQKDFSSLYADKTRDSKWLDRISLGKITSQIGLREYKEIDNFSSQANHWIEMKGIPSKKPTNKNEHFFFDGEESDAKDGKNIRFVDLWWADILQDQGKISGEDIRPWTDAVIARLKELQREQGMRGVEDTVSTEPWVTLVLEEIQETSLFAQKVAGLPYVNFGKQFNAIIQQYVGDIQAYGENGKVRGLGVARFHKVMENLTRQHFENDLTKNKTPKFTILSHSLGTVLALDSIMYGHVLKKHAFSELVTSQKGKNKGKIPNIPFQAYDSGHLNLPKTIDESNTEVVGETWVKYVKTLVTMGSPVDKYLKLWPKNYRYLLNPVMQPDPEKGTSKTIDVFGQRETGKIKHLNYSDVQDPVGHHLNTLFKLKPYKQVFSDQSKDIVFSRYNTPGIAHVKYWDDAGLFRDILNESIDSEEEVSKEEKLMTAPFRKDAKPSSMNYWGIILWTYYLPSLLIAVISALVFVWGWYALEGNRIFPNEAPVISWVTVTIWATAFAMCVYFFKKIISLFIWWRQLLKKLSDQPFDNRVLLFRFFLLAGMFILFWLTPFCIARTMKSSDIVGEEWYPRMAFGLMIMGIYIVLHIISKKLWKIRRPKRHPLNGAPEIITAILLLFLGGIAFIMMPWDFVSSEKMCTVAGFEWFPLFTMGLTALTICWIYTAFSIWSIRTQISYRAKQMPKKVN